MKRLSVILAGSTITLGLMGATGLHNRPDEARQLHLRSEQSRLRAHFDSVDNELRAASVSKLTAQQRTMRAKLVSWLRDYRNAGRFPENNRFADRAMPFFRDSHGTLCAMAYLVDRSGRGDIVDHIAKTRNNAFIHELVDDPELVRWIAASGVSVDEAARIQQVAIADATVGSISVVTALFSSFWRLHQSTAAKSGVDKTTSAAVVSPELLVLGKKQRLGLGLHARF